MCLPGLLREVSPGGLPGLQESPVAVRSSGGLREASRAAGELPEASRSSGSPPGGLPSYREVSGGFPGLREALREPFCLREAFGGVPGLREVPKGRGPPGGPDLQGALGSFLGVPRPPAGLWASPRLREASGRSPGLPWNLRESFRASGGAPGGLHDNREAFAGRVRICVRFLGPLLGSFLVPRFRPLVLCLHRRFPKVCPISRLQNATTFST